MNKNEFDSKVTEFKRGLVRELLNQCTKEQIDFFNRMYVDIDAIEESKMKTAYSQCERTLEKNRKHNGRLDGE